MGAGLPGEHVVDGAEAVAFAWLIYLLMLVQGPIGGVLYALRDNSRRFELVSTGAGEDALPSRAAPKLRPN